MIWFVTDEYLLLPRVQPKISKQLQRMLLVLLTTFIVSLVATLILTTFSGYLIWSWFARLSLTTSLIFLHNPTQLVDFKYL